MSDPRGHVEYLVVKELGWQPDVDRGGLSGWRVKYLSRDTEGHGASFLAKVAPAWRRADGYVAGSTQEFLILRGDLSLGGQVLKAGAYARFPKGCEVPSMVSHLGCELFVTHEGERAAVHATPDLRAEAHFIDISQLPWVEPPAFEGRSIEDTVVGMRMKTLRAGGAHEPYTYLVRCDGGWADLREECHETWEELFLLDGDYLMGNFGRLEAGSYIFRPGEVAHGPQATATGSVFLARGEKQIDFCFRSIDGADRRVANYFEISRDLPPAPKFVEWL